MHDYPSRYSGAINCRETLRRYLAVTVEHICHRDHHFLCVELTLLPPYHKPTSKTLYWYGKMIFSQPWTEKDMVVILHHNRIYAQNLSTESISGIRFRVDVPTFCKALFRCFKRIPSNWFLISVVLFQFTIHNEIIAFSLLEKNYSLVIFFMSVYHHLYIYTTSGWSCGTVSLLKLIIHYLKLLSVFSQWTGWTNRNFLSTRWKWHNWSFVHA